MTNNASERITDRFKVNDDVFNVSISHGCVAWEVEGETEHKGGNVKVEDIIGVAADNERWTLHYVAGKSPGKWVTSEITFEADRPETCKQWVATIQGAITNIGQHRPRGLLFIINPVSGRGTAVKDFNKKAKPLFDIAGISSSIIVSEDAGHPDRVIQHYDLSTIDGVVAVGGDGTFRLVLSALIRRYMKDARRDVNDNSQEIVKLPTKLGLLPGGTGQGLAKMLSATPMTVVLPEYDISVLQIILGHTVAGKVMTVHNNSQLVDYGSLVVSYGLLCEWFAKAEHRRRFGIFRYMLGIMEQLLYFKQPHAITLRIPANDTDHKTEWTEKTGKLKMIDCIAAHGHDNNITYDVDKLCIITMAENSSRRDLWKYVQLMGRSHFFVQQGIDVLESKFATEYSLDLPEFPDNNNNVHHIVIDGDYMEVDPGVLTVKLHKDVFKLYGIHAKST